MNTAATFVDSAFTRTAIFQEGNSSEALPSTPAEGNFPLSQVAETLSS